MPFRKRARAARHRGRSVDMWSIRDKVIRQPESVPIMGCLKGKSEAKAKPGRFRCKACGAVAKQKGHLCKPKKIKE